MEVEECLKKKQDKEGGGGWSPSAHSERWDEKDRQDEMRGRDEMGRGDDSWGLPPNRNPNSNYGEKEKNGFWSLVFVVGFLVIIIGAIIYWVR